MITLNSQGFKEYRSLIREGVPEKEAHERALSKPENQCRKSRK
jgi:hypothetical protein